MDLATAGDATLMRLTFDPMHDAEWTTRQRMGWQMELDKLQAVLAAQG